MNHELSFLFERDFQALINHVETLDGSTLWSVPTNLNNSIGHLVLHLCGNTQHFIGKIIGNTPYNRDRHQEFNAEPKSKAELIKCLTKSKSSVLSTLKNIPMTHLDLPYPVDVLGYEMSVKQFLFHLYGHFQYHLGQINQLSLILKKPV